MNTKEAARKWKCSEKTVRDYCKNGMIPLAEKTGRKWDIPDEMEKLPPVTLNRAVFLLQCLEENELPDVNGYWSRDKMLDALVYLSDMKFIIGFEGHASLEEAAKQCHVSVLGKRLIASTGSQAVEAGGDVGITAGIEGGMPTALVSINGSLKKRNKNLK